MRANNSCRANPAFVPALALSLPRASRVPARASSRPPSLSLSLPRRAVIRLLAALPLLPLCALAQPLAQSRAEAAAARAAVAGLLPLAADGAYDEVRRALRAGALSRTRAACFGVAEADGRDEVRAAYRRVVESVERLDATAMRAGRGDEGARLLVGGEVEGLAKAFDGFLDAGSVGVGEKIGLF